MDVYDVRRINARLLSKEVGTISAMADYLGKKQSQISALIGKNPVKNIGSRLAREIEVAFDRPAGWLDYLETDTQGRPNLTETQERLYQFLIQLTDIQVEALIEFLEKFQSELQIKAPTLPRPPLPTIAPKTKRPAKKRTVHQKK